MDVLVKRTSIMEENAVVDPSPVQAYPQAPEVQGLFQSLARTDATIEASVKASVNIVDEDKFGPNESRRCRLEFKRA